MTKTRPEVTRAERRYGMIRVTLSRVMGEQRIRIQELSERTGLSRSTISMLYNEKAGRIDFKTLDKLCSALGCQPSDILEYVPDAP